ncbi:hypothetical protein OUZ56_009237 [Daphnia magna]|uniref:Uncharacterized protein n=1 Tax=Daphnia magna TaxID=35525 RepID=A0ABR0AFE3_9CRUS|nr:hypothetical protein OUZ56_009237 [Daphnia magna]
MKFANSNDRFETGSLKGCFFTAWSIRNLLNASRCHQFIDLPDTARIIAYCNSSDQQGGLGNLGHFNAPFQPYFCRCRGND